MRLPLRQFLRLAALFVILIVLLTCYQFLGNAMLSAFYPRDEPAVWISLKSGPSAQDSEGRTIPEVKQADVAFSVVTPPDRQIIFSINRSEIERRMSTLDPAIFRSTLREGMNNIVVGIAEPGNSKPTEFGRIQVVYRPERPPEPVLLSEPYLDEHKSLTTAVFAQPDSTSGLGVYVGDTSRFFDSGAVALIDVQNPGDAPVYMTLAEGQSTSRLQMWPLPVHLTPSGPPSTAAVPFIVVQDRLKRQIHFAVDKDDYISITAHFSAPRQAHIFKWVEKREIAPAEFFNNFLNLSFEPWFKRTSVSEQTFSEMAPFLAWDASFTPDFMPASPMDSSIDIEQNEIVLRAKAKIPETGLQISTVPSGGSHFGNEDRVTIEVADRRNIDLAAPAVWNGNTAEISLAGLTSQPLAIVHPSEETVQDPQASDEENADQENERTNYFVLDYFRNVQEIVPQNLRAVLTALIGAIPFIWILTLIGKARLPGDVARQLAAVCVVFLILHFTIKSLDILTVSLGSLHLARLFKKPEFEWSLARLGTYYPFLAVAIVILLRPIFDAYRAMELPRKKSFWRSAGRGIILVASLLICVGIAVFVQFGSSWIVITNSHEGPRSKVLLGAAAACALFWIPFRSAIVSLLGIPVSRRAVFLANVAIIFLASAPPLLEFAFRRSIASYLKAFHEYPFFLPWPAVGSWWRWIVAILGAMLLFRVIRLATRISNWRQGIHFVNAKKGRWLLVPLMIAAIPAWYASNAPTRPGEAPGLFDFSNFAYRLDALLPYAILPAIILLVRRLNRKDEYLISPLLMSAGCLLFAYYLCGQSITVLFIPVPMLLGYFLFRYFLIVPDAESRPPDVSVGLAAFLEMRSRESIGRERKKALEKKFQQGDLSPLEFSRGISQVDDFVKSSIDNYSSIRTSKRMDAFALGPETGPWRSAMSSVKYGLIISIPFQLFALTKTLHKPAGDFPVIYLALSVIQSFALWTVISFIFGYFFHAIRGHNGFQKALNFLLALSLPTILLQLMMTSEALDTVQLLQLVQLAAFVLLLALIVFDLRLLQRHGFSWRDLPAAYGVTTSAAYLGTVALSLISAVIEPAIHDWVVHLLKLK